MYDNYPTIYLYKRVVQAKLFMDINFAKATDLRAIADEACFSKFHFSRLFKTVYGKTPHQYLIAVRIENAKTFLQQGCSVTDTCYRVGYDSVSSFTGLFKRNVKQTPMQFQQQYLSRQQLIRVEPLQFVPACFALHYAWC